ncbi:MAG: HAMP domain-containing histidine kinase, partial [Alistipes sp.]|nr:HAMP domain-containing histidine kinase [Alistipes sp.]
MKLSSRLLLHLTLVMVPVLALWSALFYFAIVDEITDEADDSLEDYSELIITRHLAGRELPSLNNGSNNSYTLRPVDSLYAIAQPRLHYHDADVYIPEKGELEPARVLTTLFTDREGRWFELQVAMPTFERNDLMETVLGWIVFLCVMLLLVGIWLTMWVFRRSLRPLYKLLGWIDRYLPGHSTEPVPNDTNIVEFQRLNRAVEQMAGRAEELYDRQKQFIGNASHELQTPLAVMGNRMEWMLNESNLTEEQMGEVMRLLDTQRHLVRLNRNLLLLTKIDNHQIPESVTLDLVSMIRREAEILGEIYEERAIVCRLTLPEHFEVEINESLASILVTNLLRNAFLHSDEGATVEVRME